MSSVKCKLIRFPHKRSSSFPIEIFKPVVGGNAINLQASVCVLPSRKASPPSRVEQHRDSTRVQGQAGSQPEAQDRLASSLTRRRPSGSHAVNVTAHLKDAMLSPQGDMQPVGTPSCNEQRTWGQASGVVPRALNKAYTSVPSGAPQVIGRSQPGDWNQGPHSGH